jgi:hypothetical protein
VSGSNCCNPAVVHLFLRKNDGTFAARQEVRLKLPVHFSGLAPGDLFLARAVTHPHLVDWDRDGHTDLVVGHSDGWAGGEWTLYVCAGPLAGKTQFKAKAFDLPRITDSRPVHYGFADWDGDGRFDLLVAVRYQKGIDAAERDPLKQADKQLRYAIYWFRNTTAKGEPRFDPPIRLLDIPEPWEVNGFSVVDRGPGERSDLVVSVSKNFRPNPKDGYFAVDSQLWRYRRKD